MVKKAKRLKRGPGWLQCLLGGFLMLVLAMFMVFLLAGLLPATLVAGLGQVMNQHALEFGLLFYGLGVLLYRWIGLDLTKREDWPDSP